MMYERLPTAQELAGGAFDPEDFALDPVDVWPENWRSVQIFADMRTQWHAGFGGRTGLIYQSLVVLFDLYQVPDDERLHLMHDIQVLEDAALGEMHKKF